MAYQFGQKKANSLLGKTPAPKIGQDNVKDSTHGNYGQGGFLGAASDVPGKATQSVLATELRRMQKGDGDDVLSIVQAKGVSKDDSLAAFGDLQDKDGAVSVKPLPTTFGMKAATPGPKIPGSLVDNQANPVRKP